MQTFQPQAILNREVLLFLTFYLYDQYSDRYGGFDELRIFFDKHLSKN